MEPLSHLASMKRPLINVAISQLHLFIEFIEAAGDQYRLTVVSRKGTALSDRRLPRVNVSAQLQDSYSKVIAKKYGMPQIPYANQYRIRTQLCRHPSLGTCELD
jgi:hypothetical protein